MAWPWNWQKSILSYCLSQTGLLDDRALDLQNLDITLGRTSVVELKNVALNVKRITQLAQLPPSLRVEAAKILSLRLTVPANLFQSGIFFEVDGVEVVLRLEDHAEHSKKRRTGGTSSPGTPRSPQHRKAHRRLHTPPPYDPGGDLHIQTTEEMVRSFLQNEPPQERKELEASVAANINNMEQSVMSSSSEGEELGTGASLGVPGFVAGFVQGVMDQIRGKIKNVEVRVETAVPGEDDEGLPVTLKIHLDEAILEALTTETGSDGRSSKRQIDLRGLSVDLCSKATTFSEMSEIPSRSSPAASRTTTRSSPVSSAALADSLNQAAKQRPVGSTSQLPSHDGPSGLSDRKAPTPRGYMRPFVASFSNSDGTMDEDDVKKSSSSLPEDLDIRAGEDNISWGSRRSKSTAPAVDIWSSMTSDDDIAESLLVDRSQTPRPQVSSNARLPAAPIERPNSPSDRTRQSPGSWPQLDHSPERNRFYNSPGSWPTLDQSHHDANPPMVPDSATEINCAMDNKIAALHLVEGSAPFPSTPPEPAEDQLAAMSQSVVYSHEDAESMYMSAMTQSPKMNIPGGWGSETLRSSRSLSPQLQQSRLSRGFQEDDSQDHSTTIDEVVEEESIEQASGNVTPRPKTPNLKENDDDGSESLTLLSKRLVTVDSISLCLPQASSNDEGQQGQASQAPSPVRRRDSNAPKEMPGMFESFASYAEESTSRRRGTSSIYERQPRVVAVPERDSKKPDFSAMLQVTIGNVHFQIDIPSCRLLYKAASLVFPSSNEGEISGEEQGRRSAEAKLSPTPAVSILLQNLQFSWLDALPATPNSVTTVGKSLFSMKAQDTAFSSAGGETQLRLTRLGFKLGESELLSFNPFSKMQSSTMATENTPDIYATVLTNEVTVDRRPITRVEIATLPVLVMVDLSAFDDMLASFGGLSGMIELGNSILSESGRKDSPLPHKPSKGVRFEDDSSSVQHGPELKVSASIGGADLALRGEATAIVVRTSTVKIIHREIMNAITISKVVVTAGSDTKVASANTKNDPVTIDLSALKLEYLASPKEDDLERLLTLVAPRDDKYDTDEDILIDTLVRQRRKGGLAKVKIGNAKIDVTDLDCMGPLSSLASEMSKLSAVADYLPEDERPGLLTLVEVSRMVTHIPVNKHFGTLRTALEDIGIAHVGLPALMALSIRTANGCQHDGVDLIRPFMPPANVGNLPMFMARMVGDEFEPTVKVKLLNVCVEYSVPVLLGLMNSPEASTGEEVLAELAQSIANLAPLPRQESFNSDSPQSEATVSSTKKTTIVLLMHDSVVGLKPQKLASKGMFILTDARLSTLMPSEETLKVTLELQKAAIFITDSMGINSEQAERSALNNTDTNTRVRLFLSKQGYASVGSIRSAKLSVRVTETSGDKSIDVDLKNELMLLETCADSTQTLIGIFGGLAPPTPPSKQLNYRTEAMTIEDMMASFTGEAFAKSDNPPEMFFDHDEDPSDDFMMSPTLGETDDLLSESEMTSSLYGPVSGVFADLDKPEDDDNYYDDANETAESLLEEDPFEMTASPTDNHLSDAALLRDLKKQRKPAVSDSPVHLGIWEVEDLGFDALGTAHQPLGSRNRFNTPGVVGRKMPQASQQHGLPFRLGLRDVHLIWKIYDGYDWRHTRETITQAVEQVETIAEEKKARRRQSRNEFDDDESVIGDFLFNSVYIGVPTTHDVQELRRQINRNIDDQVSETESIPVSGMSRDTAAYSAAGRPPRQKQRRRLKLERSRQHKVAFELKGVSADVLVFPPNSGEVVNSVDVRVRDFEIFDNVPTSTWKKFLTHLDNTPSGREMSKPMMHLELFNVKTLEDYAASEIILHVSVLPLRLHVDQDALDFITRFFEFKDEAMAASESKGEQPFLQRVEIDTVDLQLDYKPKHVDYGGIRSGHTTEFMNFVTLDAANIRLKHAIIYGIRGFEPLHKTLNDVWMPDIRRNQLPTILAGLAPVRSLVNLGTGVRDVIAIPIREYKKDGRIVRSIQKGAFQFGKTTASELARLGAKVAIGTHTLLSGAEGFLAPQSAASGTRRVPSSEQGWHDLSEDDEASEPPRAISAYANQPLNILAGLRSAQRYLEHDLLTARDALIAVQGEVMDSGTPGAVAAAVVRHAPTVILRPVIGASRAVGTALLGVGNQIDRGNVSKVEDKYKRR